MHNLPHIPKFQVYKNTRRILKNPLNFHHKYFEKLGDTFRIDAGLGPVIVFTRNSGFITHVLQKQHKKYQKSPLQTVDLAKYIGHGILTSNGEHWRTHRRMVQPAFHKKKLIGLLGIMRDAIRSELQLIQPDQTDDVFPLMGDLAFQVVAKSLFSSADIRTEMIQLKHMTETNQRMLIQEMRQPYLNWWFRGSGKIKKHLNLAEDARDLLNGLIEKRKTSGIENDDLLSMLLHAKYEDGTGMSRKQLIDEVLILFAAGHETTANTLSFTLYLLAKHPEIQQKAYETLDTLDLEDEDIMQTISKLTYIKQCVEEAMRLYPPAYIIDRITIDVDEYEGIQLPKDMMVLLSIYELHRNSDFWEASEEYRPDRFDPENKKDYSGHYYPFGAGPRMCVGNSFALYEMVLTVAEILKKYSLTTALKTVEINPLISLKPMEVPLKFIPRK